MEPIEKKDVAGQDALDREEQLRSVFLASPVGIGLVRDRVLLSVNQKVCDMTGYTEAELTGHNARMLYLSQEEYAYVGAEKYRQIAACGVGTVETRWRRKDGGVMDVLLSSAPLDKAHPEKGTTFTALDITDQKRAQAALQASESRYRELIDLAVDGILLGAPDGTIIEANAYILSLIGKPRGEIAGRHISTLFEAQTLKEVPLRFDLLQQGQAVVSERALRRGDGTEITIEMRTKRMPDGTYQSIIRDVTQRKQMEAALRQSEEQYRALIEQVAEMLFFHDLDGRILDVNPAAVAATGYTRDELLRMSVYDIDPDADTRQDKRCVWENLAVSASKAFEVRHRRKDGSLYWAEVRAGKVLLKGQEYILALANDISERKLAEAAIQEHRDSMDRLIGNLRGIAYRCEHAPDWPMRFISSGCEELTGFTPQEFYGGAASWGALIVPEDRPRVWEVITEYLDRKEVFQIEYRIRDRGGRLKWFWEKGRGVYDADGRLLALEGFITDVTDRKLAEEAAALSARRTRSLLELNQMVDAPLKQIADFALEEAIALTASRIGYLAFVNDDETALTMYAWSRLAMAECRINEKPLVYSVAQTGLWGEAVRQRRPIITNDYAAANPWKKGIPDGHVPMTRHLNIPVFSGSKIVLVAGVGNKSEPYDQDDVHQLTLFMEGMWRLIERKESQEVRDNLLKELRAKNEELQSIVFIASHDLRSPLVNVRGFTGELEKSIEEIRAALGGDPTSEAGRRQLAAALECDIPESLRFIKSSSRKMESLLNGLLRLSRIGTAQIYPVEMDMNRLIDEMIGELRFKIREHQIDIAVEGLLPPCQGDRTLIHQVFINLLDNAIKYRHPERACRIRIRGQRRGAQSIYQIEDNGIGIAEEHKGKIFEIFHQLNPESGGDGLGLTIVRRILDRQDGAIEIDSTPGVGTRVSVIFPTLQKE